MYSAHIFRNESENTPHALITCLACTSKTAPLSTSYDKPPHRPTRAMRPPPHMNSTGRTAGLLLRAAAKLNACQ
jgi:hypothetical protein